MTSSLDQLATYRRLNERLTVCWPAFVAKRRDRLVQADRLGHAAEKVAEGILEDLFTGPLDWSLADVNYQVDYADLLLTRLGIKHLLVEVKRPGALAWNRHAVDAALFQAAGYARKQKVSAIAVSDGHMLYAADVGEAGLHDRAFVALDTLAPHVDLWWISVDGIYRRREDLAGGPGLLPHPAVDLSLRARPGRGRAVRLEVPPSRTLLRLRRRSGPSLELASAVSARRRFSRPRSAAQGHRGHPVELPRRPRELGPGASYPGRPRLPRAGGPFAG